MTRKRKAERDAQIIEYRKKHTLFDSSVKFDLSLTQIHRICKKWKQDHPGETQGNGESGQS